MASDSLELPAQTSGHQVVEDEERSHDVTFSRAPGSDFRSSSRPGQGSGVDTVSRKKSKDPMPMGQHNERLQSETPALAPPQTTTMAKSRSEDYWNYLAKDKEIEQAVKIMKDQRITLRSIQCVFEGADPHKASVQANARSILREVGIAQGDAVLIISHTLRFLD